jgi:hypothetical protein
LTFWISDGRKKENCHPTTKAVNLKRKEEQIVYSATGMPDSIFSDPNPNLVNSLFCEFLYFYDHWYTARSSVLFYGNSVYFGTFWDHCYMYFPHFW